MGKPLDIAGERYGRLTAVSNTGKRQCRNYIWKFKCDCGNEVDLPSGAVRSEKVSSCGCLQRETSRLTMNRIRHLGTAATVTHGMTRTPTYISWDSMFQRCSNTNHKSYADYGGRGISICEEWRSFEAFLADMGKRPNNTTLDRIAVNGNYEPSNCRWATGEVQGNNKRTSKTIEYLGKSQTPIQWAREFGIHPKVLLYRLKNKWEIGEALTMKVNHGNRHKRGVVKF